MSLHKFIYTVVDCGPLTAPANGTVDHAMTTFQSQATYMCREGFMLRGDGTRQCLETGVWAGTEPFCSKLIYNGTSE